MKSGNVLWRTVRLAIQRIKDDRGATILISGEPGSGKSTLGIKIGLAAAEIMEQHWDWKKFIAYDAEAYLGAIQHKQTYSTVILNEAGEVLFKQEWWDKMSRAIVKSQMTDRVNKKLKVLIIPYEKLLSSGILNSINFKVKCYFKRRKRIARFYRAVRPVTPREKYPEPLWQTMMDKFYFRKLVPSIGIPFKEWDEVQKEILSNKYLDIVSDEGNGVVVVKPTIGEQLEWLRKNKTWKELSGSLHRPTIDRMRLVKSDITDSQARVLAAEARKIGEKAWSMG